VAAQPARADVVTFEPRFVFLAPGDIYQEGFARFTPAGGDVVIDPSFCDPTTAFCAVGNNTSFLTGQNDALVAMTVDVDRSFSLGSFDASFSPSPFINYAGLDIKLMLSGVAWGGGTVSAFFDLFEEPNTGNYVFSTYNVSPLFGPLESVTFGVCFQQGASCVRAADPFLNDAQFSIDNIQFGIPEPSAVWLMAIGLGLLAASRRRSSMR
jgi:hypothetical protein